jgi:hypothetical protein
VYCPQVDFSSTAPSFIALSLTYLIAATSNGQGGWRDQVNKYNKNSEENKYEKGNETINSIISP